MNKYSIKLELNKILNMLADVAAYDRTRETVLAITPATNLQTVETELEKTDAALNMSVKQGSPPFQKVNDMSQSLLRAKTGSQLTLTELLGIGRVLGQIADLKAWGDGVQAGILSGFFERLIPDRELRRRIDTAIVSEFEISDNASTELAAIRRKKNNAGAKIREVLEKMTRNETFKTYLQETTVTMRDGRYVLPVKAEYRSKVSGLIHDTSASGQTYFIEPMSVVEAGNDIRLLENKEQEEINRILSEISMRCGEISESVTDSFYAVTELNLYFAKSELALKMNAIKPEVTNDGIIDLKRARHPLIDKNTVVPVDIELGVKNDTLIVTGPNTGGKTVALKTAGLLTLMTQCGLLIPASETSKISVFEKVLADIGDEQSIEQSLSTFSAHITNAAEILRIADSKSLVLLDELGSGTDPVEGAALAVAIIKDLRQKRVKLMVTTHYQELKIYALETDGVENASCEFDINTLRPTYKLITGTPGKSKAFAISQRLGISQSVIEHAQSLVSTENMWFDRVIGELEAAKVKLEEENTMLGNLRHQQEIKNAELEKELESVKASKEKELEQARLTAMRIIEDTKYKSNELITELDKLRKEKDKSDFSQNVINSKIRNKQGLAKLYRGANPVTKTENGNYTLPRALKKGDDVLITDINKKGTVLNVNGEEFVTVQIGIMKSKVSINKLRLIENQPADKEKPKGSVYSLKGNLRPASLELDIRGRASDEGIYEVESFINDAIMNGIHLITIIHGKGTGILRAAVQKHLREMPAVKTFRNGVYGEGEEGVTIAELR